MIQKQRHNFYAAINDDVADVVNTLDGAKAIYEKPGGHNKGFNTYKEAEQHLKQLKKERAARLKKKKQPRNKYGYSSPWNQGSLSHLDKFKDLKPKQPVVITLTCSLGTGGFGSTIKSLDFDTHIMKTSKGATPALMYLELGYAALKLADYHIKQGADTVKILGLNASVSNTLDKFAPNWKANNWLNPAGKSPANRELVQSMLELYEPIQGKVTLGAKQTVKTHTDDLPF